MCGFLLVLLSYLAWYEVGFLRRLFRFARIPFCFVCATSTAQHRISSYGVSAESDVIFYNLARRYWLHSGTLLTAAVMTVKFLIYCSVLAHHHRRH